ncbi:hypothetical protein B296_00039653 [Ensete ventricosum]|uniref:Uncharacterized protein n=1 Tax=Ensete ventricosum TaxID=4639 RepID=A0A426ZSV4_ENSVE|nr:hypothetical protein B296_00039653 [Ensete ventricosum]
MQPTHYRAAEVPTSGNRGNMRLTCYRVTEVLISGDKWEMQPTHYRAIEMSTVATGRRMIRVVGELDCSSAHIRLRKPDKSEDKAESSINRITSFRSTYNSKKINNGNGEKVISGRRFGQEKVLRCQCQGELVERGEEATMSPEGLSNPKAKRRSEWRWIRRSATVPQRRIYRLRRKGCKCEVTDSSVMSLAALWYRRNETFVESSIPCSHGERVLNVKGAEEMKNAEANSKYQDKAEGQRQRNFIRLVSTNFSSR